MKRRTTRRRHTRVPKTRFQRIGQVLLWIVIMTALLLLALWAVGRIGGDGKQASSVFAIRSITVKGNEHYNDDDIIGVSGLHTGKSVLTLNKSKVRAKLIDSFAYIQDVSIDQGDSFRDVVINITEQPVFAATYYEGDWLLIGQDGRLLETRPVKSDTPGRYMQLRVASINKNLAIGDTVVAARDQKVIDRILAAFADQGLTNVTEIDISNRNDITVHWNNRLQIRLGNNTNLEHEIAVVAVTIPRIDAKHGTDATGVLDLRSYADATSDNNYAVFTPQELLPTTTFPMSSTTAPEDGSTTGTDGTSSTSAE